MNKKNVIVLFLISLISLFLHFYKISQSPPCLNADEASFGYNAYSLLKTGQDEYGQLLPLRLRSFGDYKLPLLAYITIPFISLFGLNDFSIKLPNALIIFILPWAVYFFSYQLFKNKYVSLLSALLIALCWGMQSIGRQLHESLLCNLFVTFSGALFLKIVEDKHKSRLLITLFFLSVFLSLFSYHPARVYAGFFFVCSLYLFTKKHFPGKIIFIFFVIIVLFAITDILYKPTRLSNLLFFNNRGFQLEIDELRVEGGPRFLYNKLTIGLKNVFYHHIKYFSPQFLVTNGDENFRFGFPGLSPITIIEYVFFLIGIYYLIKNKVKWRFYLAGLLFVSPLSASLSWNTGSLTRSLFILIPILITASYGIVNVFLQINKKNRKIFGFFIILTYLLINMYNWDFYLNHYPKRGVVIQAWQCGYKQLARFVRQNYSKYKTFYISKEHGQPYIFLLFYLTYPPEKYQAQAKLSTPDQYGFGQVEDFDKFVFSFNLPKDEKSYVSIAYPHDFIGRVNPLMIKKIKQNKTEIFWIYQSDADIKLFNEKL